MVLMGEEPTLTREELKDRVTLFFDRNDVDVEDRERVCRELADDCLDEIRSLGEEEEPEDDDFDDDFDIDETEEDDIEPDESPEIEDKVVIDKPKKKKPGRPKKFKVKERAKPLPVPVPTPEVEKVLEEIKENVEEQPSDT